MEPLREGLDESPRDLQVMRDEQGQLFVCGGLARGCVRDSVFPVDVACTLAK